MPFLTFTAKQAVFLGTNHVRYKTDENPEHNYRDQWY